MIKLAPSLLAADFSMLKNEINKIERAGAHYLHLDVMDGHFVPNISFGLPVIKSLRPITGLTFDAHLMVERPERFVHAFAEAGADIINVHAEACGDVGSVISLIKAEGKRAALSISPQTDVTEVFGIAHELDMVLVMSVEPGFGGQGILPQTLAKAEKLANFTAREGLALDIEMDGGIYTHNVRDVLNAGVNVVVAGTAVFGKENAEQAVRDFYTIFEEYYRE